MYAADNEAPFSKASINNIFNRAFLNAVGPPLSSSSQGISATQPAPFAAAGLPSAAEMMEPRGGRMVSQREGAILGTPGPYQSPPPSLPTPDSGATQLSALQSIAAGLDPNRMAAEEYAAQFALLDQLARQAQERFNVANRDVGSMYEALAKSTEARTPQIQQEYAGTGQNIKAAYDNATQQVSSNYGNSINQIGELLGRLGIQQAGPTVMAQTQTELTRALADLAARSQGSQQLNATLGQNEQDYNRRTVDTERMAGRNQQADLTKQLQSILADYGNKRLGLQGEQTATANKYKMSIAQMLQQEQSDAMDRAFKQQQLDLQRELGYGNLELGKSRLAVDANRYQSQAQQDAFDAQLRSQQALYGSRDAVSIVQNKAAQMYGNASDAAQATRDLLDIYSQANPQNISDFFKAIEENAPTNNTLDRQRLKELGATFYLYMNQR